MERAKRRVAADSKGFIVTAARPRRWPLVLAGVLIVLAGCILLAWMLTPDESAPTQSPPPPAAQPRAHT
jgi:hypothetical protein